MQYLSLKKALFDLYTITLIFNKNVFFSIVFELFTKNTIMYYKL